MMVHFKMLQSLSKRISKLIALKFGVMLADPLLAGLAEFRTV